MPFESKTFFESNKPQTTIHNYVPTLFIGLGGTGRDVLMRLRKRLYDQSGPVDRPYLRFLMLDTDMKKWWPSGAPEAEFEPVKPQPGEFIDLQINAAQFNQVFQMLEKQHDPRYTTWLKPEMSNYGHAAVIDGAGTHRQFGRMAFLLNHSRIEQRIESHLRSMLDDVGKMDSLQARGVVVQTNTIEVVIVTSLAGGTGSGVFLDVAYLVKDVINSHPVLRTINRQYTTLIAVMPTAFEEFTSGRTFKKFQRNAYGALLELEHYGTRRTGDDMFLGEMKDEAKNQNRVGFRPPWAPGRFINGQGWEVCYLIDNINPSRPANPLKLSETCQMIADYLFLDFQQSQFAVQKRSNRCNLTQWRNDMIGAWVRNPNLQAETHMESDSDVVFATRNGCAFSSFGLSEITFSRDRVYRAAAYLLASRLVLDRWLGRAADLPQLKYEQMVQEDFYSNPDAEGYSFTPSNLMRKLYQVPGEQRNYFSLAESSCKALHQVQPTEGSVKLRSFRENHSGVLQQPNGIAYRVAVTNADSMAGNVRTPVGPLRKRVRDTARNRANEFGVSVVRELLGYYSKATIEVAKKTTASPQVSGDEGLLRLEEADELYIPARRLAQRIEFPRACTAVEASVMGTYRATVAPFVNRLMVKVREYIGKRGEQKPAELNRVDTLYEYFERADVQLRDIGARLHRRFEEFSREQGTPRSQILSPEWTEREYNEKITTKLMAHPEIGPNTDNTSFDWGKFENRVFQQLQADAPPEQQDANLTSLNALLDRWFERYQFGEDAIAKIAETLQTACYGLLAQVQLNLDDYFDGCVIDLLTNRYSSADRSDRIDKFIRTSTPYLHMDIQTQQFMAGGYQPQQDNLLGSQPGTIRQTSADNLAGFLRQLRALSQNAGADLTAVTPVSCDKSTVVLCREVWGVPLQYYSFLNQLHQAYMESGRELDECHINAYEVWEDLPDVRAIDSTVYEHISMNVESIILAMITGTITRGKGEAYAIRVPGDVGGSTAYRLGSRINRIVKKVCEEDRIRNYLREVRDKWELTATPTQWAMVYASSRWTYEFTRVEYREGPDSRYMSPVRNCIAGLLRHAERRLATTDEGLRFLQFLRPAKADSDETERRLRKLFEELFEQKKILFQPLPTVPICEVNWELAETYQWPTADGPAAVQSPVSGETD